MATLCILTSVFAAVAPFCTAQSPAEFHRTLTVSIAEPLVLEIELSNGNLQVAYAREGEVTILVHPASTHDLTPDADSSQNLVVEQSGNHVTVHEAPSTGQRRTSNDYRIDVPYRCEVHISLGRGNTLVTGVMGPVKVHTNLGNIAVSYVSENVKAQSNSGDLDFQVVGGHIEATTGTGNISCTRSVSGVQAVTDKGDISLTVVGASEAEVKRGTGRIVAEGIRGKLKASTDAGDVRVRAVPHEPWQISSVTGTVRVELPPKAGFDLDALTESGEVIIRRDDLDQPATPAHHFFQKANGGGKQIAIRTTSGSILID